MRWDVFAWAAVALLLFAAEALAPGAFMLWLGFAAAVVFVAVLLVPGHPVAGAGRGCSSCSASCRSRSTGRWFRGKRAPRATSRCSIAAPRQLVGRVVPLERAIVNGRGRVQIADALWDVDGPDLPAGTPVRIVGADGMTLRVEAAEREPRWPARCAAPATRSTGDNARLPSTGRAR